VAIVSLPSGLQRLHRVGRLVDANDRNGFGLGLDEKVAGELCRYRSEGVRTATVGF
jgi:hypothetical protein